MSGQGGAGPGAWAVRTRADRVGGGRNTTEHTEVDNFDEDNEQAKFAMLRAKSVT